MDHIDRVGENIIRKHLTRISKEFQKKFTRQLGATVNQTMKPRANWNG